MFKKLSVLTAVVCAFAFTGIVLADTTAPATQLKSSFISGEVISVNVAAKQIVVKNSEDKLNITLDVSNNANIRKGGKAITLYDIAAGDKVVVAFRQKGDKRAAISIKVRAPK